jgi:hypothetical protein
MGISQRRSKQRTKSPTPLSPLTPPAIIVPSSGLTKTRPIPNVPKVSLIEAGILRLPSPSLLHLQPHLKLRNALSLLVDDAKGQFGIFFVETPLGPEPLRRRRSVFGLRGFLDVKALEERGENEL